MVDVHRCATPQAEKSIELLPATATALWLAGRRRWAQAEVPLALRPQALRLSQQPRLVLRRQLLPLLLQPVQRLLGRGRGEEGRWVGK